MVEYAPELFQDRREKALTFEHGGSSRTMHEQSGPLSQPLPLYEESRLPPSTVSANVKQEESQRRITHVELGDTQAVGASRYQESYERLVAENKALQAEINTLRGAVKVAPVEHAVVEAQGEAARLRTMYDTLNQVARDEIGRRRVILRGLDNVFDAVDR